MLQFTLGLNMNFIIYFICRQTNQGQICRRGIQEKTAQTAQEQQRHLITSKATESEKETERERSRQRRKRQREKDTERRERDRGGRDTERKSQTEEKEFERREKY